MVASTHGKATGDQQSEGGRDKDRIAVFKNGRQRLRKTGANWRPSFKIRGFHQSANFTYVKLRASSPQVNFAYLTGGS